MHVYMSIRSHISNAVCPIFTKFYVMLPVAETRSFFDDNAMRYVLPVSCFAALNCAWGAKSAILDCVDTLPWYQ